MHVVTALEPDDEYKEEKEEEEPLFLHLQMHRGAEAAFHWPGGTILDRLPLRRSKLEWLLLPCKLVLIFPTLEGRQSVSTDLVLFNDTIGAQTQNPKILSSPP